MRVGQLCGSSIVSGSVRTSGRRHRDITRVEDAMVNHRGPTQRGLIQWTHKEHREIVPEKHRFRAARFACCPSRCRFFH